MTTDQLDRLKAMAADGQQTWDLSRNDERAIGAAVDAIEANAANAAIVFALTEALAGWLLIAQRLGSNDAPEFAWWAAGVTAGRTRTTAEVTREVATRPQGEREATDAG